MARFKYCIIILVLVLCPIISYGQIESLSFESIDSIQISPSVIKIHDINNDNIDDLIVGTNGTLKIYNGATRNLIWEDTENLYNVTAIEVGDIENDGLLDYFVGHFEGPSGDRYYYLTIYFGNNLNNPINWPGYIDYPISHIYFYNQNDSAYINVIAGGTYKINLCNWSYRVYSVPAGFNYCYTHDNAYYIFRMRYIPYDEFWVFFSKYSVDGTLISEERILGCYMSSDHYPNAFGNFVSTEDKHFYLFRTCLPSPYGGNPDVSLYLELWNIDLLQIDEIHFPDLYYARKFTALNVYGDTKDELLLVSADTDTLDDFTFILNGDGSVHARSALNDTLNIFAVDNFNEDEYDEILCNRNGYLVFIKPVIGAVDIIEEEHLPRCFTTKCYPNPFNSRINIDINSDKAGNFKIEVFDLLGRSIKQLHDGFLFPGKHSFIWQPDLIEVSSGIYLLMISNKGHSITERMVYLK
ncbi:MAG: T9SS type A sorting domain-containing protein [candidate division Zixibacteria bacterium]|nr:T9SS type A sorting domain-containing protein [candidate division Zixibacteria bacterium]